MTRKRNPFYRPEHDPKVATWIFLLLGLAFIIYQLIEIGRMFLGLPPLF